MLDSLDALIAFVTVILALSLLVTTIVQMILNLTNMRGRQLCNALTDMFAQMPYSEDLRKTLTEKTNLVGAALEEHIRKLTAHISERILTTQSMGGGGRIEKKASAIDPNLIPLVLADLKSVLAGDEHRPVYGSDSRALVGLLDLAESIESRLREEMNEGMRLAQELAAAGAVPLGSELPREVRDWREIPTLREARSELEDAQLSLANLGEDAEETIHTAAAEAKQKLADAEDRVMRFMREKKDRAITRFDNFMNIAGDRFRRSTGSIGFAVAFMLCAYLQVDSLSLLREFQADPEAASVYVESSSVGYITGQEEGIGFETLDRLNDEMLSRLEQFWPDEDADSFPALESPRSAVAEAWRLPEWSSWIERDENLTENQKQLLLDSLTLVFADFKSRLSRQASELFDAVALANVQVMGTPRDFAEWKENVTLESMVKWLFTAILLSLGAPFWFNVLRQLTSLRSSLAAALDPSKPAKGKKAGAE